MEDWKVGRVIFFIMGVKIEQDDSKGGSHHIRNDICELGASCRKVDLNQFNQKAHATSNDNGQKKESKI